ncbi:MAG: outer membrane protein [Hyphomicrobiales bacterium]
MNRPISKTPKLCCKIAAVFTCLLGLSTNGHAEDWSGFYIGIGGGYFYADTKIRSNLGIFPGLKLESDGGQIGGYLGYNFQIENVILGIDGDVYAGFGGDTILAGFPVPSKLQSKAKANWSVRGRAGWAIDRFMPYIAGGYAGKTNKLTVGTGYLGDDDSTLSGWTIGGGGEFMITPHWLMRVDYQYHDYGKRNFFSSLHPDFSGATQKVKQNQITVGGAFKF